MNCWAPRVNLRAPEGRFVKGRGAQWLIPAGERGCSVQAQTFAISLLTSWNVFSSIKWVEQVLNPLSAAFGTKCVSEFRFTF